MTNTRGWGRGRRYRDMQKAIDGVPPLTAGNVVTVVAFIGAVVAITIVLRVATRLADGYTAAVAIAVVVIASIWWSRRRRAHADDA